MTSKSVEEYISQTIKQWNKNNETMNRNKTNEIVPLNKTTKDVQLDYGNVRKAMLVLRAVKGDIRQRIIDLLDAEGTLTVTDIYIKLRLEQAVVSTHLTILRRAGIVTTERQGKFIYYSLDKERVAEIVTFIDNILK